MWRPAMVVMAFPILLALGWPILRGGDGDSLDISTPTGLASALWMESIVLTALFGAGLSSLIREVHRLLFAYTVPSLRAKLFRGQLLIGIVVALVLGLGLVYAGDLADAGGLFACAMLFFSLGVVGADPIMPRFTSLLVFAGLLASAFESDRVRSVFESMPVAATGAALIIAAALLSRVMSTEAARIRTVMEIPLPGFLRWGRFRSGTEDNDFETAAWRGSVVAGRMSDWIKAADYENFGSRRHGWLKALSWGLLYNCGIAHAMGMTAFAAFFGYNRLPVISHRLTGKLPYPIRRMDRASLGFVCGLFESLAYFLPALGLMWWLETSGVPRFTFAETMKPLAWNLAYFPIAFIWSPVVQWVRVTTVAGEDLKKSGWTLRYFAHTIVAVVLMFLTHIAIVSGLLPRSRILAGVAVVVLVALVQLGYWVALRWHFEKRDIL